MPARPFSPAEIALLESRLFEHGRYRDRMLIIAGTQVGYRITELLTWTVGQVLGPDGDIVRCSVSCRRRYPPRGETAKREDKGANPADSAGPCSPTGT